MRTFLTSALVLFACGVAGGCADHTSQQAADETPLSIPSGPDPIVLRMSRDGGLLAATIYPALDSTVWRSNARVPALKKVLAFGGDDGYLAAIDRNGSPVRVDLRLGSVATARRDTLLRFSSIDGATIYGLKPDGRLVRYAPSGSEWEFHPESTVDALLAQTDGSLVLIGVEKDMVRIRRIRPPNEIVSDSTSIRIGGREDEARLRRSVSETAELVGDRIYLGVGSRVLALRSRDLGVALDVDVGGPIEAMVATPSGDRVFVAIEGKPLIRIADRFDEGLTGRIRLPSPARALRMDPFGRTLLIRGDGDSIFVASLADDRVTGTLTAPWLEDLPLVTFEGAIAVSHGEDVELFHPATLSNIRSIKDGGRQFWYTLRWNGTRPRAAGLDKPVEFRSSTPREFAFDDSVDRPDDGLVRGGVETPAGQQAARTRDSTEATSTSGSSKFMISFATLLDEQQAKKLAQGISVEGRNPRVMISRHDDITVYRVVLGPFATRDEAERTGRLSGQNYWVYEDSP